MTNAEVEKVLNEKKKTTKVAKYLLEKILTDIMRLNDRVTVLENRGIWRKIKCWMK